MNLRDELQAIYDEQGRLTPALVVDAARPKSHPLHDRFEWDNRIAGEKYRLQQAHTLIRTVRETHVSDKGEPLGIRSWHAVRDEQGHAFKPTDEVLADPLATKILLADMRREWASLKQRYDHFVEFREIVRADMEKAS